MKKREDQLFLQKMRSLTAQGWHDEALLVDTAAQLTGGDEQSKLAAQRVYDRHFKIAEAN